MAPNEAIQLNRNRGAVKRKLTNFITFLKDIQNKISTNEQIDETLFIELKLRVHKLSSLFEEFEAVQISIEYTCEQNDLEAEYAERDDFTNKFSMNLAIAEKLIKSHCSNSSKQSKISQHLPLTEGSVSRTSNSIINENITQGIKLPTIELPKFKGNYNSWLEFKDTFDSLIHSNSGITEIQKFHYLRASLEGDAIKIIQSLEFTADNYTTAWQLLCDRFNNSRLLVHNHIKSIFDLQQLSKESASGLRTLIDNIYKHYRALESLKQPVQHWNAMLIYILTTKLDKNTTREWEKHKVSHEDPTLNDFKEFLQARANLLETLDLNHGFKESKEHVHARKFSKQCSLISSNVKCYLCGQSHLIYACNDFLKLSVAARRDKVKQLNLCLNCLCTGHVVKNCRSGSCRHCKQRHNSLLHNEQSSIPESQTQVTLSSRNIVTQILLSTARVVVKDCFGQSHSIKAILDSGSQSNFVSMNLCRKLQLNLELANISIQGINTMLSQLRHKCQLSISSVNHDFQATLSCLVLPKITERLPTQKIDISSWNIPSDIQLADPEFNVPAEIDLLIGASHFWDLIKSDKIKLSSNLPILQNSVFGFLVSGPTHESSYSTQCYFTKDFSLSKDLKNFWEIEENLYSKPMSPEDKQCEQYFLETYSRNTDGRFIVRIPLRYPSTHLGDSKQHAIQRFLQLEKRFKQNATLKEQYVKFMKEYLALNHMSQSSESIDSVTTYFLPHHGVLRKDSLTTKLRVVFDGSAATTSGWSVNDIQFIGPPIYTELFNILLQFRQYPIAVCADIEKMYRQIQIHPDDQFLQNILWRDDSNDNMTFFTLNTVTYGMASAPYLAIRCLKELASNVKNSYPFASQVIANNFYVDDLIASFESEEHALEICQQVSDVLRGACFPLRKWTSNSSNVLNHFKVEDDPISIVSFTKDQHIKTLGVFWDNSSDLFFYKISPLSDGTSIISKRTILSEISKIFDPLGLLGPCVIVAKILIQRLWALQLNWDDAIPTELQEKWLHFKNHLHILNDIRIQRHAICKNPSFIEIHGFSDASTHAYGACVYMRSVDIHGKVQITLLCAKTRVSPLKVITVPRLELCGATMLAKLVKKVSESLTINPRCFFWCDSQIVLCWIRTAPNILNTFVGNRIAEIQSITDKRQWSYINSKENPADLASRGVSADFLKNSQLWWNGPSWLVSVSSRWADESFNIDIPNLPEVRSKVLAATIQVKGLSFPFQNFSSLTRLKRTMAYCLRFIKNAQAKRCDRQFECLTVSELDSSMTLLVKIAQGETFTEELRTLKANKSLSKHKLLSLSPFIDEKGLLRVGGRLKNSQLQFDSKHPLLLSGKHHFSKLIIEQTHKNLLHAGPQLVLSTIRQNFWLTSGMSVVKKFSRSCIRCFRLKPISINPVMADLPKERVTVMNPFQRVGVDYAGPMILKDKKGRGCNNIKGYVCLFICFVSKAIHLELVTDLSTNSFLAALRRFIARRGKPSVIFSDNGTNFVGAKNQLQDIHNFFLKSRDEVINRCATDQIDWKFIPPNSPHFGGLWESGVKSLKFHLIRVLQNSSLVYEEFNTVLVQIESILNSRPLHPLSSDPNDLQPLTPSHFLIGRPLVAIPDPNIRDVPMNRLNRFQYLQSLQLSFWKRWSTEYLSTLQQRNKWRTSSPNLEVGSLVLIKQENLHPCQWQLGRIVEVYPDKSNVVRVASVRTSKGIQKRAVAKLCPLPVQKAEN